MIFLHSCGFRTGARREAYARMRKRGGGDDLHFVCGRFLFDSHTSGNPIFPYHYAHASPQSSRGPLLGPSRGSVDRPDHPHCFRAAISGRNPHDDGRRQSGDGTRHHDRRARDRGFLQSYKAAIFVTNRAAKEYDAKIASLEDQISSQITDLGFNVLSRRSCRRFSPQIRPGYGLEGPPPTASTAR